MFRITDKALFDRYDDICHRCVAGMIALAAFAQIVAAGSRLAGDKLPMEGLPIVAFAAYVVLMVIGFVLLVARHVWASRQRSKYYIE